MHLAPQPDWMEMDATNPASRLRYTRKRTRPVTPKRHGFGRRQSRVPAVLTKNSGNPQHGNPGTRPDVRIGKRPDPREQNDGTICQSAPCRDTPIDRSVRAEGGSTFKQPRCRARRIIYLITHDKSACDPLRSATGCLVRMPAASLIRAGAKLDMPKRRTGPLHAGPIAP